MKIYIFVVINQLSNSLMSQIYLKKIMQKSLFLFFFFLKWCDKGDELRDATFWRYL